MFIFKIDAFGGLFCNGIICSIVKQMVKKVRPSTSYSLPSWYRPVFIMAVTSFIGLFIYLLFVLSGWNGYVVKYIKCGYSKPVITSSFMKHKVYYTPGHERYSAPGGGFMGSLFFAGYYCSEAEAIDADYKKAE